MSKEENLAPSRNFSSEKRKLLGTLLALFYFMTKSSSDLLMSSFACLKLYRICVGLWGVIKGVVSRIARGRSGPTSYAVDSQQRGWSGAKFASVHQRPPPQVSIFEFGNPPA
jgi:hypothetical protein